MNVYCPDLVTVLEGGVNFVKPDVSPDYEMMGFEYLGRGKNLQA